MKKQRIKYLPVKMKFNNALLGYEPQLPEKKTRKRESESEINWIVIIILIILIIILLGAFAIFY